MAVSLLLLAAAAGCFVLGAVLLLHPRGFFALDRWLLDYRRPERPQPSVHLTAREVWLSRAIGVGLLALGMALVATAVPASRSPQVPERPPPTPTVLRRL